MPQKKLNQLAGLAGSSPQHQHFHVQLVVGGRWLGGGVDEAPRKGDEVAASRGATERSSQPVTGVLREGAGAGAGAAAARARRQRWHPVKTCGDLLDSTSTPAPALAMLGDIIFGIFLRFLRLRC